MVQLYVWNISKSDTRVINQYKSTAYHPESQRAFERFQSFHQILKNMIALKTIKSSMRGIQLFLFAARESTQDSLGFSPFELVFGHTA